MSTATVTHSTQPLGVSTPNQQPQAILKPVPSPHTYRAMPDPYCPNSWKVAPDKDSERGIIYHFHPNQDDIYGRTAEDRARAWEAQKNAQRVN